MLPLEMEVTPGMVALSLNPKCPYGGTDWVVTAGRDFYISPGPNPVIEQSKRESACKTAGLPPKIQQQQQLHAFPPPNRSKLAAFLWLPS